VQRIKDEPQKQKSPVRRVKEEMDKEKKKIVKRRWTKKRSLVRRFKNASGSL